MKKLVFALSFLGVMFMVSCTGKEEKKENENNVQQVKDTVVKKEVTQEKIEPEIVFTVQIGAYRNENKNLSSLQGVQVTQENTLFKYRLQRFEKYQQARNYRESILDQYPDAFIQAVKNGKPIHIKQALK